MKKIIELFPKLNIAIIGDVMLDIFTYGISERLSPEAPVPVIRILKKEYCAGGAGNVAKNLDSLQIKSSVFGVIGNDKNGEMLRNILQSDNIEPKLLCDDSRPTTVKERIIANQQQMLRVDDESATDTSSEIQQLFCENICSLIRSKKINAVIFSDYKKGVLSNSLLEKIVSCANEHNIITALDPKPSGIAPIRNLTILKPNRAEVFELANMHDDLFADPDTRKNLLLKAAQKVYNDYQPEHLVISLSSDGLAVYEKDRLVMIPTAAREIFDVSGAGDTLMASMTAALAAGANITSAAGIGNIASGIAVGKRGTSFVTIEEIKQQL